MSLLLMQMLMAQVTRLGFVGSTPDWLSSSGTGAVSTSQMALPSGCRAGDMAVLSCVGQTPYGFAWATPPDGSVVMQLTVFGINVAAVYSYTLKQADIDAGTVTVAYTADSGSPASGYVQVDVYRNASVDVIGTLVSGTTATATATATVPGVTTPRDGEILQYTMFLGASAGSATVTPPAGWELSPSFSAFSGFAGTGHRTQNSAGATGNAVVTISYSGSGVNYVGLMLSIRPKVPAITLTLNLPAPTVGVAYSGSITAANVDGATGVIAITATPLPAGLSVGTRVDNGDGSYTLPITGTPTTAQTVNATITATNGTQTQTTTQNFVVSAASTGMVLLDLIPGDISSGNASQGGGVYGVPLTATFNVTAGDTVTAVIASTGTASGARSCKDNQNNVYTLLSSAGTNPSYQVWQTTVAATGSLTISVQSAQYFGYKAGVVAHTKGGTTHLVTGSGTDSVHNFLIGNIPAKKNAVVLLALEGSSSAAKVVNSAGLQWTVAGTHGTTIAGYLQLASDSQSTDYVGVSTSATETWAGAVVVITD